MKVRIYRWLYVWALKHWRKAVGNPYESHKPPKLTLHAVLRYFERFENRDLVSELLNEAFEQHNYDCGGNGKFVVDGIQYTVVNGKVVTITSPSHPNLVSKGLDETVGRKWSF